MKKITKNFFLLALVVATTLFSSCSKDDDDSGSYIGTWKSASSTTEYFYNGESYYEETSEFDENNYQLLVLNEDNTFESSDISADYGTYTDEGTYRVADGVLYITYDGDTEEYSTDYVVSGDVLKTTYTYEETYDGNVSKTVDVQSWDRQ